MTDVYNNVFAERNVKHPMTDFEAFIHIVKASLGAGVMAMPNAFQRIGLWLGIPAIIITSFVASYCIHMLVKASQTLCFRSGIPQLSYGKTAEEAVRQDATDQSGVAMRFLVNTFLVINSLGCICVYFVTSGRHIHQVIIEHAANAEISLRIEILIIGLPMLGLCLVRDLKYLVPFSMVANILVLTSLIITFIFIFEDLPNPSERRAVADVMTWPSFFSIYIFAFENVGVILPCENAMKTPAHFTGCPSVLVAGMSVVSFLYTFVGFFGCLKYGELTKPNISLNLPKESWLTASVNIMIAVAVYFTILLQFYVAIRIVWRGLEPKIPSKWQLVTEICVRVILMLLCLTIAVLFPDLGPFIALIGAVTFTTLGLTLPAVIDLIVFRVDPGFGFLNFHLIKDLLIIAFGLTIFVLGTAESIKEFKVDIIDFN